jgi:hypothetical protein
VQTALFEVFKNLASWRPLCGHGELASWRDSWWTDVASLVGRLLPVDDCYRAFLIGVFDQVEISSGFQTADTVKNRPSVAKATLGSPGIMYGLNRLRKNSRFAVKFEKHPSAAKAGHRFD